MASAGRLSIGRLLPPCLRNSIASSQWTCAETENQAPVHGPGVPRPPTSQRLSNKHDQRSRCWIVAPARELGHASAERRTRVLGGLRRHGLTSRSPQALRNWGLLLWIQMTSRHHRTRLLPTYVGYESGLPAFAYGA